MTALAYAEQQYIDYDAIIATLRRQLEQRDHTILNLTVTNKDLRAENVQLREALTACQQKREGGAS